MHPVDRTDGKEDFGGLTPEQVESVKNELIGYAVRISQTLTGEIPRDQFRAKLFAPLQRRLQETEGLPLGKANTVARKLIDEYFASVDEGRKEAGAE